MIKSNFLLLYLNLASHLSEDALAGHEGLLARVFKLGPTVFFFMKYMPNISNSLFHCKEKEAVPSYT